MLAHFRCSVCGAPCPKAYLEHGRYRERMKWLRRHYKKQHPRKFKRWNRR